MSPLDFKWVFGMFEEIARRAYAEGYQDGADKTPEVQNFTMTNSTKLRFKKMHQEFANPPKRR